MKFMIIFAVIAAVSAANVPNKRFNMSELEEIIAAIHSPSTDPATAAALEQMLQDILGGAPIDVGPAIVEPVEEISVGPAIVEPVEDISVGPAIVEPVEEISVGPALVEPSPPAFSFKGPLVQVIVNVDSASSDSVSIEQPALVPAPGGDYQEIKPDPVIVVDQPEPAILEPEPVVVGTPVFPDPAVNLPEPLN